MLKNFNDLTGLECVRIMSLISVSDDDMPLDKVLNLLKSEKDKKLKDICFLKEIYSVIDKKYKGTYQAHNTPKVWGILPYKYCIRLNSLSLNFNKNTTIKDEGVLANITDAIRSIKKHIEPIDSEIKNLAKQDII